MATFFCIYSGKDLDEVERSDEHIVPYALGGSNQFVTRDASKKANNDLGSFADAALIDNFFMTNERWSRGIKSQGGNIPDLTLSGTVEINGKELPVDFIVHADRTTTLAIRPEVESDWANKRFRIECDPRDFPSIATNIERKAQRKGIDIRLADRDVAPNTVTIEKPWIKSELAFDMNAFTLGYIKMALATGHYVLGELWSRGDTAARIRAALKAGANRTKVDWAQHRIRGGVWPNCGGELTSVMHAGADRHVLLLLNTGPLAFYALLFGKYDGMVCLDDDLWERSPSLAPGDGAVFVLDVHSRQVQTYSFVDFLTRKERGQLA